MRPLRAEEEERLVKALHPFGRDFLERWTLETRSQVLADERDRTVRLHLVDHGLAADLAAVSAPPQTAGLFLGELEEGRLHFSLEGAYEVGLRSRATQVVVNEKAAGLFLYGRDVLGESVVRHDPSLRRGDVAFVTNLRGEVLGLAEVLQDLPGRGPVLRDLADRGWYLRGGG